METIGPSIYRVPNSDMEYEGRGSTLGTNLESFTVPKAESFRSYYVKFSLLIPTFYIVKVGILFWK